MWIVSVPFFAMSYINDARYIPGETTLEIEKANKPRENNVPFLQSTSPSSPEDLSSYNIFSVQVLRNIARGEELLPHYGHRYEFYGR